VPLVKACDPPELLTVKPMAVDVPPPGAGVNTVMFGAPAVAMSLARIVAVSWLADTYDVLRALPLTWITELPANPLPLAVSVKLAPPAATVVGLMVLRTGTPGAAVTLRFMLFDVQTPPVQDAGLVTTMATLPCVATSVACTAIVSWVPELTVAVRATPPTVAVAPFTNPVPVTVRVKAVLPAAILDGLKLLIVGVGLLDPPPLHVIRA